MALPYPKRPPMFAMKAMRLMVKTCLAQRIGADGVMLLMVVASTEDAAHYRRPVDFWNEQLAPLCGFTVSKLRRVRDKCVESGWLAYEPGAKSRAARYWVQIPDYAIDLDDAPSDEGHDREFLRTSEQESAISLRTGAQQSQDSCAPVEQNPAGMCAGIRQESGRNVRNIQPVPIPDPIPNKTPLPPSGLPPDFDQVQAEAEFIAQWNATPGVVICHRHALGSNLSRQFADHVASSPGWLHRARDALRKFPLPFYESIRRPMSLKKFLEEGTVDGIIAGTYDQPRDSGTSHDPSGARINGATKFDAATAVTGPREV